jgi:ABC-type antimicrobial peptide transport system permease subunit
MAERTPEIGIRSALGARPGRIVGLVLLLLTAAGVVLGVIAAGWMSRFLEARLFGVGRLDLATYAGGAALMLGVALAGCAVPGRRAVRVDPMVALHRD